jgi:hypothetical protein
MSIKYTTILLIFITLLACYDRKEFCLDSLASNYDVTADDACADCCTYPLLKLSIKHMTGDSTFRVADTLTNDLGQTYAIEDVRYYLSNFTLFQKDSAYTIRETIMTENNVVSIPNHMKILRGIDANLDIGSIRAYGTFDSLTFDFGLSTVMTDNTFVNLATNHVLTKNNKLKNPEEQTAYFTMRFKRITPVRDTVSQFIYITKRPALQSFTRDTTINTTKGNPIIFPIKADYAVLFKNINMALTVDSLSNLIFENLNKMIIVK